MFTGFMFIALAVCLLLGACPEAGSAYETSFGALLERAVAEYILEIWTGFTRMKTTARDKARDNVALLVFTRRSSGVRFMP